MVSVIFNDDFRKNGSACFHDYLQSRQLQNKDFPALLALEQRYCRQEPISVWGVTFMSWHKSV